MASATGKKAGHIGRDHSHLQWSKHNPPVVTVSSGEVVTFDAIDSSNGQISRSSNASAITTFDTGLANPVFGPVYVQDAKPGDVLKVEVMDLQIGDWGWTAIIPGFGLLADEFPTPVLHVWEDLDQTRGYTSFKGEENIRIPLRPFLGCMGVAPGTDDGLSTIPPTDAGGNIDCRDLTVGSVVYLPVFADGALFSCGDGHATQGHGEVCGTAIETPMKATLRFEVCKNKSWVTAPHYEIPPSSSGRSRPLAAVPDRGRHAVMGVDPDIMEASRKAVRNTLRWLMDTKGLRREEAYMLASVVGDLQIVEAVNIPNYIVAMSIPLGIFGSTA
ncbi:hypothetical protein FE257_008738 [Aspergillus nanangensis]|uniref:Acetamidase/formamidase family protein n=1 Tax=Aspergillus nanangensis TaxID=2582783 RepID=A0AAD4CKP2_ASPNN|nr:hypothetical protein FE257_008738 [Aspergillus nanangensis]